MRLVVSPNLDIVFETSLGEMDREQVVEHALKMDGRTLARLQADCGFTHPRLAAIRSHSKFHARPGFETCLIALMEMGYEVTLTKKVVT